MTNATRETFGNIPAASVWAFYLVAITAVAVFAYGVYSRYRLWRRGQPIGLAEALKAGWGALCGSVAIMWSAFPCRGGCRPSTRPWPGPFSCLKWCASDGWSRKAAGPFLDAVPASGYNDTCTLLGRTVFPVCRYPTDLFRSGRRIRLP